MSEAPRSPTPKSPKSPKSPSKRAAPAAEKEEKSAKKAKTSESKDEYQLNVNKCVDKEHENKTFSEIIKLPPSALQGLAEKADPLWKLFNIKTIEDLAHWKYFKIARAIVALKNTEQKGKRDVSSKANINKALDKEYEKKSLAEIVKAPVSALQGLASSADEHLAPLKLRKIEDLANWKYGQWADALVTLAQYESADGSS